MLVIIFRVLQKAQFLVSGITMFRNVV